MSAFMKTSPISSSYGMYGTANVNPYSSYFGPQTHNGSSTYSPNQGAGAAGGFYSTQSNSFMSPSSSLSFNPHSFGAATSPFASPGQQPGGGGGQHFVPLPAQTRIIGGVHTGGSNVSFQQSPPRYFSSYSQQNTPGRSEEFASEPMHYSPIHVSANQQQSHGFNVGIHNNSPTNNIILPSYLLGLDNNYHHSFHQSGTTMPPSPGPCNQSASGDVIGPSSFMNPAGGYKQAFFSESSGYAESDKDGRGGDSMTNNRLKGPPIHGFGSTEGSSTKDFMDSPWMKDSYNVRSPVAEVDLQSQLPVQSPQPSSTSATAVTTWVTVFGFPAGASSFILTNFSTFGKIMEVKATHGSNWLHIRYSNKIEARRALSKNGKVLGGSIMVGVVNSDLKVVQEAESAGTENPATNSPQLTASPTTSILRERNADSDIKSRIRPLATGALPQQQMTSRTNPKSLSQMPSLAREAIEVERNPSGSGSLPSASSGMFTKAMEFMFGW